MSDIIKIEDYQKEILSIKKQKYSICRCGRFEIDTQLRLLNCIQCKKVYDPYEACLLMAKCHEQISNREKNISQLIKQKSKELEEIERKLANKKASLRRANKNEDLIK